MKKKHQYFFFLLLFSVFTNCNEEVKIKENSNIERGPYTYDVPFSTDSTEIAYYSVIGTRKYFVRLDSNERNGRYESYYWDGSLNWVGTFDNDTLSGFWRKYTPDGYLDSVCFYSKRDKRNNVYLPDKKKYYIISEHRIRTFEFDFYINIPKYWSEISSDYNNHKNDNIFSLSKYPVDTGRLKINPTLYCSYNDSIKIKSLFNFSKRYYSHHKNKEDSVVLNDVNFYELEGDSLITFNYTCNKFGVRAGIFVGLIHHEETNSLIKLKGSAQALEYENSVETNFFKHKMLFREILFTYETLND